MLLFSDWWVILMSSDDTHRLIKSMMECLHNLSKRVKSTSRDRWSQSISKYNLLTCCFREPPSFIKHVFIERIKDLLTGLIYVESGPIDKSRVMKFIVEELQTKSKLAADLEEAKEVTSARGNFVYQNDYFLVSECLRQWTTDLDYDASVLTWHLATDIIYWSSDQSDRLETSNEVDYRFISKELSDYMSYLLLRQQTLTSPVMGLSHFRFKDTCSEAKKYSKYKLDPWCTYISTKIRKMVYELLTRKPKPKDFDGLNSSFTNRITFLLTNPSSTMYIGIDTNFVLYRSHSFSLIGFDTKLTKIRKNKDILVILFAYRSEHLYIII
ncbi:hypothetical protein RND81_10G081000 [Saponaria officinalis]|uniref:Uncharacterized protein n=1 Tax=Saponaria officinalis TaxID=3572 RepID=A0AAW1I1Q6_SAPOF